MKNQMNLYGTACFAITTKKNGLGQSHGRVSDEDNGKVLRPQKRAYYKKVEIEQVFIFRKMSSNPFSISRDGAPRRAVMS